MNNSIKAVIVGCGLIASRWTRMLLADGRVTIAALIDPVEERSAALAAKYQLHPAFHRDLEDSLNDTGADVLVNLAPPDQHAAVSAQALQADLHVLSEKPLTTRIEDAERLIALAAARQRLLAVMNNRGLETEPFADLVRAFGPGPYAVSAETMVRLPDQGFRDHLSHAATIDLAVHIFDQIQRIIPARAERLSCLEFDATTGKTTTPQTTITVTFEDGSVLHYRGGFAHSPYTTPATGRWRVDAAHASLAWDGAQRVTVTTRDKPPWTHQLPGTAPGYQRIITAMIDALLEPGPYPAPDLTSIALLDTALHSIKSQHGHSTNTGGRS